MTTQYIAAGEAYADRGDWVTCVNDHPICMFNRKVFVGDDFDMMALGHWQQTPPLIGQVREPLCNICNGRFVKHGNVFHFHTGWRRVENSIFDRLKHMLRRWWRLFWLGEPC